MRNKLIEINNDLGYSISKISDMYCSNQDIDKDLLKLYFSNVISSSRIVDELIGNLDKKYKEYDDMLDNVMSDSFKKATKEKIIEDINTLNNNIKKLEEKKTKTKIQKQLLIMYKKMKDLKESILIYKILEE
jgi:uncharacterized coiled-coil protein SlyX